MLSLLFCSSSSSFSPDFYVSMSMFRSYADTILIITSFELGYLVHSGRDCGEGRRCMSWDDLKLTVQVCSQNPYQIVFVLFQRHVSSGVLPPNGLWSSQGIPASYRSLCGDFFCPLCPLPGSVSINDLSPRGWIINNRMMSLQFLVLSLPVACHSLHWYSSCPWWPAGLTHRLRE